MCSIISHQLCQLFREMTAFLDNGVLVKVLTLGNLKAWAGAG